MVESAIGNLRRVDTLVIDKTGTLTEGHAVFDRVVPAAGVESDEVLRLGHQHEAEPDLRAGRAGDELQLGVGDRQCAAAAAGVVSRPD